MVNGGILPSGATRIVPDRFAGRVALVTGSTQGLGETLARRLVAEGLSGLVVTGRNAERGDAVARSIAGEQRHDGSTCEVLFHPAALDDAAEVEGLLAAARDRFGVVHHLANCAAFTERQDIWEATPEFHDQMMAVNLRAPMQLMQGVAQMLRDAGQPGSVVNIGSVAAYGGFPGIMSYSASKMALVTLSRSIAFQLMRHGIRVNVVQPGWMDTPAEDQIQRQFHGATDGWLERAEAEQPWGRLIKPAELATTLAFVLSDDAGMMSGAVIDFDQTVAGVGDLDKPGPELGP